MCCIWTIFFFLQSPREFCVPFIHGSTCWPMLAGHFRVLFASIHILIKICLISINHKKSTGDKNSKDASNIFGVASKEFLWKKTRAYNAQCFKGLTTTENEWTGYRVKGVPSIYYYTYRVIPDQWPSRNKDVPWVVAVIVLKMAEWSVFIIWVLKE